MVLAWEWMFTFFSFFYLNFQYEVDTIDELDVVDLNANLDRDDVDDVKMIY